MVYILRGEWDGESGGIMGVFDDPQKAKSVIEANQKFVMHYDFYVIEQWAVNGEHIKDVYDSRD